MLLDKNHRIFIPILPALVLAYDIICPDHSQRQFRSDGLCIMKDETESIYTCLEDVFTKTFKESCTDKEHFVRKGHRYVIKGQSTIDNCSTDRYQPLIFYKTSGPKCMLLKSTCNEVGQVVARSTIGIADTTCICDYTEGYAYITRPADVGNCVPSEEDCSCYVKLCPTNSCLSANNECIPVDAINMTECSNAAVVSKSTITLAFTALPLPKIESATSARVIAWTIFGGIAACGLFLLLCICVCKSYKKHRMHLFKQKKDWIEYILRNWKNIKRIVDPIPLMEALSRYDLISTSHIRNLDAMDKRLAIDHLLIISVVKIKEKKDFENFKNAVIEVNMSPAEIQWEEQIVDKSADDITENISDNSIRSKSELENILQKEHIIKIKDDFLERLIFSLEDAEEIFNSLVNYSTPTVFIETVFKKVDKGSVKCLIRGLRSIQNEYPPIFHFLQEQDQKEQMTRQLENWKKDDQMFVETGTASLVLQCIKDKSCVTVTGSSGVGKTFTLRHVALKMAADGFDILALANPADILKYNKPDKKTLFVIDDLCGTYTLNRTYLDEWIKTHDGINTMLLTNKSTKIIVSCRLQVFNDERFKLLPLFIALNINLSFEDNFLSKQEKQLIAEQYLKSEASNICEDIDLFDYFPLLCRLYHDNQTFNVIDFFKNPLSVYTVEINKLLTEKAFGKYCALALCVMFNNQLREEWLTDDVNQYIQQIGNTCVACQLNRETPRLTLLEGLDSLIHKFLKKEQGFYQVIYDQLFDFLIVYFGTHMMECLIKNAASQIISERFVFEKNDDSDQFIVIVPDEYHEMYIERMINDWSRGEVVSVFANKNMKSVQFRNAFLINLNKLGEKHQEQLATTCDNVANTGDGSKMCTPLRHSLALGDVKMVEWCCRCGADVNFCCRYETSPLYIACQRGFTDIVTELIKHKADINKGSWDEVSPLYIACKKGHSGIVTTLVEKGADINLRTIKEESPLYIACKEGYIDIVTVLVEKRAKFYITENGESVLYVACQRGFIDIVRLLLNNEADFYIHTFTKNGESPLSAACKGGYTEIVTMLLANKADVNKCLNNGESPLYIACKGGFMDIVTLLVDKKADINKCTRFGTSPLDIACKGGHTSIVNKLVDNQAEINKRIELAPPPLIIACMEGYTDIVTTLVHNNAEIDNCTKNGESPLYIACQRGFLDIVTKLLDNKANIDKCSDNGESPLYIACKGGYTDIVTKLVDKKANIDKCTKYEESPLYIACKGGYTDIVAMLVDKADINKCESDGESPLYIACKGGYTKIVTMLVNKADINKCERNGESPLYIACKGGYTEIVTLLVDKADINTMTLNRESPLYIANQLGYAEIVTMLKKRIHT